MKRMILYAILAVACISAQAQNAKAKTDPNHTSTGGYGYTIGNQEQCHVWWAEATYKVMQNTPTPTKQSSNIELSSAKNEWESFILVINPKSELKDLKITVSPLTSKQGTIEAKNVVLRKVEYVNVTHPTDYFGFKGLWPDPIPLYQAGESVSANKNQPYWISVKVPANIASGLYSGTVTLSGKGWQEQLPLNINVWNFELPKNTTMRSGFGLGMETVAQYDNLHTEAQKKEAFEHYMEAFRDYKLSPYDPFQFSPIVEKISGVEWNGGLFDSSESHNGKYSYMVADNSATQNIEASTRNFIEVNPNKPYQLSWWSKSKDDKQQYVVGIDCYDAQKNLIVFENRFEQFTTKPEWNTTKVPLGKFDEQIKYIQIHLYPSLRTFEGENRGTVWFDDIELTQGGDSKNLLAAGDFEVDIDKIDISLDFTDFNIAAKKYFNEYGFNSYRMSLKGIGGGTYYSRQGGVFEGFAQDTPEYNKLMQRYLSQIQANLEQNGVLGKEYIYWFDEPNESDYEFIRRTNAMIKQYAPRLTTFLTEHISGQDISDVTDISCTIWHKLDHAKIAKMNAKGLEHWSYLCVWPKAPWISEFIDHDAVNMRMWLWGSYVHGLKGILMWQTTYWNSKEASPKDYLQNPWEQAMSWVTGYGWIWGKQTIWGNGDGRFFYPLNRDPNNDKSTHIGPAIPSLRLETLRDGIEDYEYMVMLENLVKNAPKNKSKQAAKAKELLKIPTTIYTNEQVYNKDPQAILDYRKKLADAIISLQ